MSVWQYFLDLKSIGRLVTLVFVAVFAAYPRLVFAHHSFSPLLTTDGEETITVLEGTVRVFRILNPHGALILNVPDGTGTTEGWLLELSPAAQLRLLVAYGIRGNTPTMLRLRERLPTCGTIDASYNRTECFLIDAQALLSLEEEFPGQMGYVMP